MTFVTNAHQLTITTELFLKNGYDFTASKNVRDILYNTDAITCIVDLTVVHSLMG